MSNSIFDNAVLLSLTVGLPGNHRKVASGQVEAGDADHDWINVSKHLVESEEYDGIGTLVGKVKGWVKRKAIFPQSNGSRPALRRFIKPGVYLVPLGMLQEVDERVNEFRGEFATAIEKFLARYPELKEQARSKLGKLFDENDYPDEGKLRAAFYVDSNYITLGTPDSLQKVSSALLKRERDKAASQMADAYEEVRQVLRQGFAELVDWMVKILEPGEGGRKRQFRESSVRKFMEFLEDFKDKDLTGDAEMQKLVGDAKSLLNGQSPDSLRESAKSEDFRDSLRGSFKGIQERLEPLVGDRKVRLIVEE